MVAQIVIILHHDCEIHLDHNCIMSQQSAPVQNERIRTYMHVPDCSKLGTPIVLIASDWDPIVDLIRTILSKRMWSYLTGRPDRVAWNWVIVIIWHPSATNRVRTYHFLSKPEILMKSLDQPWMANLGVHNGLHDSGNIAFEKFLLDWHEWKQNTRADS